MIYAGGLTFDSEQPDEFLRIPNHITAHRFGKALLDRLGIYRTVAAALETLSDSGAPGQVLWEYLRLMRQRDVDDHAFKISEENHRDILWAVMLNNPALAAKAEFKVDMVRITNLL